MVPRIQGICSPTRRRSLAQNSSALQAVRTAKNVTFSITSLAVYQLSEFHQDPCLLEYPDPEALGRLPEAPWEEDQVQAGSEEDTTETLLRSADVSRHQEGEILCLATDTDRTPDMVVANGKDLVDIKERVVYPWSLRLKK
ncbi:unnamed protein product [Closterium sp. Yama58-4]|nr:unnamed protein product [Closterium sp. Yama58-4]